MILTLAIQGCWFQKQALEWMNSSTLVLYIVTIIMTHHLIMLWSAQGVGVIIKCLCKGLQEWAGQLVVKDAHQQQQNRLWGVNRTTTMVTMWTRSGENRRNKWNLWWKGVSIVNIEPCNSGRNIALKTMKQGSDRNIGSYLRHQQQ